MRGLSGRPNAERAVWIGDTHAHTHCRVCETALEEPYLDLGVQPLANGFLDAPHLTKPEFTAPLQVVRCARCGLSQLTMVIARDQLYSTYPFQSGVSPGWRRHCTALAESYSRTQTNRLILDIGSNDGTMLQAFLTKGHRVIGIEPAGNLEAPLPIHTIQAFWSAPTARVVQESYGFADLVLASNVVGHVDDLHDFFDGIRTVLAPQGTCCIEVPHIEQLLNQNAFDTIYHEHLSYWSLRPLQEIARQSQLCVYDVQAIDVHGGSRRYYLCHESSAHLTAAVAHLWSHETRTLGTPEPYHAFAGRVADLCTSLLQAFDRPGLCGLGAPAKGNTLLNTVGGRKLHTIFDDSPEKQGLFTPGQHIPVHGFRDLSEVPSLVILAWNWAADLKRRAKEWNFDGEFLTPIPTPVWEGQ